MIDDWLLSLIYAAWLAASTMPLGFMLGSSCSPCCGGCGVADGKPRTDPVNEGTWVPSGTWRGGGGVTWSFTANPGDESGETWFFYGSAATSRVGGEASTAEQRDWGNICNWYSNKTTSPSTKSGLPAAFDKRATRLPPDDAIVHVYTRCNTAAVGPRTVKHFYLWSVAFQTWDPASEVTATAPAHDSAGGAALVGGTPGNYGIINGGATAIEDSYGTINDGAKFIECVNHGTVNGGANFYDGNPLFGSPCANFGTVNGGADFTQGSSNDGIVNDGATFSNSSENVGTVNGGATFNNFARNFLTVNGGATFNDAACSTRTTGDFFASPCTRKFVAHPTDLPTCNGTAPAGCDNAADSCGCN